MSQLLVIIVALLTLIVIHELGHFVAARAFGMRVECFFVGFGKKLWSFTTRRGVEVGVRAIPAGGYVRIPNMDLRTRETAPEDSYARKKWYQQVVVGAAGVAAQLIITVPLLFGISYLLPGGEPTGEVVITSEKTIGVGEKIVAVEGEPFTSDNQLTADVTTVTIQRGGETIEVAVENPELITTDRTTHIVVATPLRRLLFAVYTPYQMTGQIIGSLGGGVTGLVDSVEAAWNGGELSDTRLRSVLGVGDVSKQATAAAGWFGVGIVVVQLNLVIAVLNLLPLYPFDGGHIHSALAYRVLRRNPEKARRYTQRLLQFSVGSLTLVGGVMVTAILLDITLMLGLPGKLGVVLIGGCLASLIAVMWLKRHELTALSTENKTEIEDEEEEAA